MKRYMMAGVTAIALTGATLGAASSAASPGSSDQPRLSAEQIISKIVGNTIRYQNDSKNVVNEFYSINGSIQGNSRTSGLYGGEWQIRFGHSLCFVHADPLQSGCVEVSISNGHITFYRRDGVVEGPFELRPGNPEHL